MSPSRSADRVSKRSDVLENLELEASPGRHCLVGMVGDSALKRPALVPESEEVLVQRAANGDERAFAALYRRHARHVAGVAFRLLGNASELDDIVQETFLICLSGLGTLKEPGKLRSWLVTIAVRRVQRRLAVRSRTSWLSRQLGFVSPTSSDPGLSREVADLLRVLEKVSPKLRVPWTLARIEGGNLEEVAEWCGISVATAKRRIARADQFVRRMTRGGASQESPRGARAALGRCA
jgi:RNA polymerase sigma-70 factor (ECF subfamily)